MNTLKNLKPSTLLILFSALLLPLVLGGIYYTTQIRSKASGSAEILDAKAVRISNVAAEISFRTSIAVQTTLQCALSRTGVRFFAGEDADATTQHLINTQQFNVTLNTNTPYYCYIYSGDQKPTEIFVPASPLSKTFGIDGSAFSNDVYGACKGDEDYDPSLDINQDGCVLLNDLNEFPEY
ncbi:MAG: hypothetical protein UZ22_OP11002000402 [Microgenomates bacterium OLB23]|nr:MAG: hypothetical protein UZ22_OP11002000402 [Microgenomates bacterium OLB23]